jgi:carbohydrate kinase (thermoresistant glucokinase family)
MAYAIVLMGVSGSGKTSVGMDLSRVLGVPFYDGDDYHPHTNIEKMEQGIPLNDDDRRPWLGILHQLIYKQLESGQSVIVASSALKSNYRKILRGRIENILFVYLIGSFEQIFARMQNCSGHYMKAELRSQFSDLEEPKNALIVSIEKSVPEITFEIIDYLNSIEDNAPEKDS